MCVCAFACVTGGVYEVLQQTQHTQKEHEPSAAGVEQKMNTLAVKQGKQETRLRRHTQHTQHTYTHTGTQMQFKFPQSQYLMRPLYAGSQRL